MRALFDLSGRVAVVTGGAGGIGEVYAEALCEVGASVVIADINVEAANRTADALKDRGFPAIAVRLDVTSAESAAQMASATIAAFGGIDILINNAAVMTDLPPYGLSNMPVPDWDRVLNVNLRGPLLCTQAVIESMTERGGGRIVNGLSAGAFMPGGIHGVSKYALHGLTCNLAAELGSRGINVNGIAPGLVPTKADTRACPRTRRPRDPWSADPRQDIRPTDGLGGHDAAAVLACGRLDQRPDDLRRRRLDHAALTTGDRLRWKDPHDRMDESRGTAGRRASRVRANHDGREPRTERRLPRVRGHRIRLR